MPGKERPALERFEAKVDKSGPVPDYAPHLGPCWIWTGYVMPCGYGQMTLGKRAEGLILVHRFSYQHYVGPIPEGLFIDHLCRVRNCCRPEHLEPVTNVENMQRGNVGKAVAARQRAKTHCPQGHEYTPENTYIRKQGWRTCRECSRVEARERQRRKRAALRVA